MELIDNICQTIGFYFFILLIYCGNPLITHDMELERTLKANKKIDNKRFIINEFIRRDLMVWES